MRIFKVNHMCSIDCLNWGTKNLKKEDVKGKRVLEVGSLDVNGSLRHIIGLLGPSEYVGADIRKGPSVDVVCPAEDLVKKFGEQSFDLVVSTCVLEHIKNWKESVSNIKRVCRANGAILIIVPSKWPFHDYPCDFWRYSKEDIRNVFSDCDIAVLEQDPKGRKALVYAKIRKPKKFVEKDLSSYLLYSIITGKKESQLNDEDFQRFRFGFLVFKKKVGDFFVEAVKWSLSKI